MVTTREAEHASSPEISADALYRAVRAELIKLRGKDGISHYAVATLAPTLQTLPIVDAEMRRNPLLSRSVATYEVVRCCIYAMLHPDLRQIVVTTMNVGGHGRPTLTERREDAKVELGVEGTNNYLRREEEAYAELVADLIAADDTPCASGGRKRTQDALRLAQDAIASHLDQSVLIEVPLGPIAEKLLGWLANEINDEAARDYVEGLLTLFPRLRYYGPDQPTRAFIVDVVERLIRMGVLSGGPYSNYGALFDSVDWSTSMDVLANKDFMTATGSSYIDFVVDRTGGLTSRITSEYYVHKAMVCREVAERMAYYETTERWHEVFPPTGQGTRQATPVGA